MNSRLLIGIIEVILGVILNVFIGKIARFIFKKDGTGPRAPLRFAGIWLFFNGISIVTGMHIL
ncbi:hypothetical protein SAMN02745134_02574 [Clostridium acidisoli DSM 12555]|uniref:Uncharacterized protein n=1 Tax=Clostridium acidisoli DSM 12555 TaxID=1121291 RepID=A0A1W1XP89_9CLOT|nr:hypothetical protein [Clostridium acidisoli]SMC25789.1 hypothetical protein SAMN02745134_02574 [Clostridium acidisoli DSM 12555]